MTATTARAPLGQRPRRLIAIRAIATLVVALAACTGHEASSSGESAASVAGPDAQAGAGRGHLQLTGDATVDTDFAVEQCTIGPAGDGLLDGYHMTAKAARGTLQLLSLAVRNYEGDGTFSPPVDTGKTAIVGKRGVSGPLSITIGRENTTVPLPVITRPESKLTVTISDSGSRGIADFTDMTSPVAMEDVDIKDPLHAKRKTFAGSVTWHCASVERLDAATTDAAKAMTKGLTPIH
jgi:hypothetical protein